MIKSRFRIFFLTASQMSTQVSPESRMSIFLFLRQASFVKRLHMRPSRVRGTTKSKKTRAQTTETLCGAGRSKLSSQGTRSFLYRFAVYSYSCILVQQRSYTLHVQSIFRNDTVQYMSSDSLRGFFCLVFRRFAADSCATFLVLCRCLALSMFRYSSD